ncbi:P-loop containing nucleoside triphosphate hydrolase protein, partial [Cadophora sp. MPI-SDFR-AT-0126]
MTLLNTPSFTLYYTSPQGTVLAKREKLVDWPELMGSQVPGDFVAYDPFQLIGSRPEVDPDSLLHWDTERGSKTLPMWGESGDEGCYDTDTWREIDRERGDIRRRRTRQRGTRLDPSQLNDIWNQAVNDYIEKWRKQKLPKLEKTAAGIWLCSRRTRTKRIQVKAAQNDLQHLQTRLTNLQAEFASVPWSSWSQAVRGCRNMELTVFSIQTLEWTIDTLQQKTSPGVPFVRPSKRVSKPQAKASGASSEAEDDIDDGIGGFVTDDENFDAEGSEEEEIVDHMEDSDDELVEADRPRNGQHFLNRSTDNPSTPVRKSQLPKRASEIIDLTDSPPLAPLANSPAPEALRFDEFGAVDLLTPEKRSPATPTVRKVKLMNRSMSPLVISSDSEVELPPFANPMAIAEFPYEFWEKAGDRERLLVRIFYKLRNPQHILGLFAAFKEDELWELMCQVLRALQVGNEEVDGMDSVAFERLSMIAQLLAMYMECKFVEWGREMHEMLCRVLLGAKGWWHGFYKHCSRMEKFLDGSYIPEPRSPLLLSNFTNLKPKKRELLESDDDDEGPTKRRRIRVSTDASDEDYEDVSVVLSPQSTRKRPVIEDLNAREARKRNAERIAEQERRRTILKAKLAESGNPLGQGKTKHIINDAAELDQGHVYVNEEIGHRIKQHQVDGVRFMWNQIVAVGSERSMQGCLLAHTMGLGKTMQVITLLVAISEAASSPDPSISSQIPSSLKGTPKTLVLCPPGLIDNWMDELLFWTPGKTLGEFWKIGSSVSVQDRLHYISEWYSAGGVLVVGYEMLRNLVQNKTTATRQAPLTEEEHERVLDELLNGPDIIIADEAHKLKNAKSGLASAASGFRSKCRIALTGSPLANNVEEYHSMIEFVQPGYLGGAVEFRSKYKEPIEEGLFADSNAHQRRTALKMLGVLNKELALKVNRADLSVLRNDLPPKKEFVISVPLTDIQRKVYSLYVRYLKVTDSELTKDGEVKQTTLWSWLATLSLLCNHPYCFRAKMQEGKKAPEKQATLDNSTDDDLTAQLIDVPLSKVRLSTAFIAEVTRLFADVDLTQVNLSNKVTVLCQILDAAKEAGDKTLIFSSSIPTLDFLENLFKRQGRSLARLDGKTAMAKRQRLIKNFNKGDDEIFLISTTAGGLGLNLQSANRVIIFDFKYNPIQEEQAVGRAYRIGQLKPTFVYRFVCGGTFEDNVHNKTVFKAQLASRVVDKKSPLAYAKKKFGDFLFEPKDLPQKDLSQFRGMDPAVLDRILASQAQQATIRSIVQTDTFEMDDEDRLTPEEQKEVDKMCQELKLQQAQRQALHL